MGGFTNRRWGGRVRGDRFRLRRGERAEDLLSRRRMIGIRRLRTHNRVRMFRPTAGRMRIMLETLKSQRAGIL